jgi:phosphodiesterase/alkaline phosphatase D-like protein
VTRSAAKLLGSVNPLGATTTVKFQYGKSKSLGSTVSGGKLHPSGTPATLKTKLSGLPAGTKIFYRVVAKNAFGTSKGAILTFRTGGHA